MYIVKWGGEGGGYYQTRPPAPILYWIQDQKGATRFATKEEARKLILATWRFDVETDPCAKIVRLKKRAKVYDAKDLVTFVAGLKCSHVLGSPKR